MTAPRFLFITTHNPFNPTGGALQRTRLLFDALRELGHVDLVCFSEDQIPERKQGTNYLIQSFCKGKFHDFSLKRHLFNMLKIWSPYSLFQKDPVCAQAVRSILEKYEYDCIVSRYIEPVFLCGLYHESNLVIDVDDALDELYRLFFTNRQYSPAKRFYYLVRFLLAKHYSGKLYPRARHLFFANPSHVRFPNSSYLPNIPYRESVRADESPLPRGKQHLLFVGTMSYPPNYLGMDLFIRKCWDQVLDTFPDARLRIVGKGVPKTYEKHWKTFRGIDIRGFADNLSGEYEDCNLVIAPIYHGSGTNIKVLEAMMAHRSCVVSGFAATGFSDTLINRHNVMIAHSHSEFTSCVIELLQNKALNNLIRGNAAATIKSHFQVKSFNDAIKDYLGKL